ncbi:MAG: phosphatidylserine decarboxylase [Candidatus Sericytochromatia bacterium]|uniref:phosphatidylserine decarboxylase n=1 Tax=Candidatus Tanganyikabacteria bacterium TaxID=2961651 RepID=A0A937X585_9BACT|nr:phosphatidylserine decarboxylase [Candidatus Tanganyikabacteria bacterium]
MSLAVAAKEFRDRRTGRLLREEVFAGDAIRWLYGDGAGTLVLDKVVNTAWFCRLYGRLQDSRDSARRIPEFISRFKIDMNEAEKPLYTYRTFNQFFARKLKAGARPFETSPDRLPAPAEGKILAFERLEGDTRLPIKGANIPIDALLAGAEPHEPFKGGSALVVRLAPYDYHRFHFPDAGTAGRVREIPGRYHSVNPIAFTRVPDLFCRNKRTVLCLDSRTFGKIAYVAVGALCVGTIVHTYRPGEVGRGDEAGYFLFGGSTVVLLFEPGAVAFDDDLISDSANGLENQVQVGTGIGRGA